MAILNFPATGPGTPDDGSITSTQNGVLYVWDGNKWTANSESDLDNRYVERAGDNMTGNLTLGGDKIKLYEADGSAEFDGPLSAKVITGTRFITPLDPNEGANTGISLNTSRGIQLARSGSESPLFRGYKVGTTDPTSLIDTDGSAQFAGDITSTTKIQTLKDSGNKTSTLGGSTTYALTVSNDGGTSRIIQLNYDGSAQFAGGVSTTSTTNDGCLISEKGAITIQRTSNANVILRGYNKNAQTSYILADGSATFLGNIILCADSRDTAGTGDGFVIQPGNTTRCLIATGASKTAISIKTTGQNGAKASIKGDGTANFPNVFFNLEADDDTKYTATTDEDGNETRVYNGAVLDVKDRLTKLDTALSGLKAALVSTTDHASLKAALISALADI